MSTETIQVLITAVLFLQGVSHARGFVALVKQFSNRSPGPWLPLRSWLFPSLTMQTAAAVASIFWLLSAIGFIASSLSFWGFLVPGDFWRQLAIASAIISTLGIVLFSGTWPGAPNRSLSTADTVIALILNLAILVALLVMHWPPYAMFGK